MIRRPLASLLLAALTATPVWAQAGQDAPTRAYPQAAPTDPAGGGQGHGFGGRRAPLTREQAQASVARGFAALDTNGDGVVTRDEYDSYRQARRAAMMARRQDRDGGAEGAGETAPPVAGADAAPGGRGRGGVGPLLNSPGWFDLADADHDGRVTLAEAQTGASALFDRMDLNHDGVIEPQERWQAMGMRRGRGGAAPEGAPSPQ